MTLDPSFLELQQNYYISFSYNAVSDIFDKACIFPFQDFLPAPRYI